MLRNILLLLCVAPAVAAAQPAGQIPRELLENSDAVVRSDAVEVVYNSPNDAVERHRRCITILNQAAAGKGFFVCPVDGQSTLRSFRGAILDANGKVLRKLKRGELSYSEYSSGLADDAGCYLLEVRSPRVPYTVELEYEVARNDAILSFAPFIPVTSTSSSLEKADYTLSMPAGTPFGYKARRIGEPEKSSANGRDIYRWRIEGWKALPDEEMSPDAFDLLPMVLAVPYDFRYARTQGSMRDWQSFGAWLWGLLEGRDRLPEELRSEVHARTDTIAAPRDKVRSLYDYLGESTRYVSIQLGIGGLQPMSAEEVFRTKFGDCKALTNYLRAMLAECGIPSDYAIINVDRPRMFRDFASASQANHAILRVPLERDTLWLECTNTEMPFGYIHNDIAGHDAILVTPHGGQFVTLPRYADSLNRMVRSVEIEISADGAARGKVRERFEMTQYEWMMGFRQLEPRKQRDLLLSRLRIPTVTVDRISCTESRGAQPSIEIVYDFSTPSYVNFSGQNGFVQLFPFDGYGSVTARSRTRDFHRETGYLDIDRIRIRLAEGLQIEALPRAAEFANEFGTCRLQVTPTDDGVEMEFRTLVHSGDFPRGELEEYRRIAEARKEAYNGHFVVKRP